MGLFLLGPNNGKVRIADKPVQLVALRRFHSAFTSKPMCGFIWLAGWLKKCVQVAHCRRFLQFDAYSNLLFYKSFQRLLLEVLRNRKCVF